MHGACRGLFWDWAIFLVEKDKRSLVWSYTLEESSRTKSKFQMWSPFPLRISPGIVDVQNRMNQIVPRRHHWLYTVRFWDSPGRYGGRSRVFLPAWCKIEFCSNHESTYRDQYPSTYRLLFFAMQTDRGFPRKRLALDRWIVSTFS